MPLAVPESRGGSSEHLLNSRGHPDTPVCSASGGGSVTGLGPWEM